VKLDVKIFLINYFENSAIDRLGLQNVEFNLSFFESDMSLHSKHLVNIET